jgi:YesN/AraC family two-component response regulator
MKYVDLNIEKPLTVHGIAESLGYSIYHISHTFKEKTNITLQDYIANKKTEKAKEMMLRGRLTLTEIADKLGYMSIQSFSRSFKKKEGVSPSEYINNSK